MSSLTVQLKDFPEVLKKFSNLSLEQQKTGVASGIMSGLPLLVAASPVDTGLYAQSWDMTEDEKSITLGNYAPHAPIIEDGARPFTPPIGPLLAWAKRVLQDPSQPPDYSPEVWALARGTQRKISEVGMKPRNILRDTLPQILQNIVRELKAIG